MKQTLCLAFASFLLFSCNNEEAKKTSTDSSTAKTDSSQQKPRFTLEETTTPNMLLMAVKDTANSTAEIGQKLGVAYGSIMQCAEKCKMGEMAGAPMAFYASQEPPFAFEAAVPYRVQCPHPEKGIYTIELKAGKAAVAHYFGPYEEMAPAYEALVKWLTDHKKVANGKPYEVYIGDPMIEKDPYKVQTDIYMPFK
jgi:effector-binding domain-containing protein